MAAGGVAERTEGLGVDDASASEALGAAAAGGGGSAGEKGERAITLEAVQEAARRIAPYVHRTPVLTSRSVEELLAARVGRKVSVFFKAENFQVSGSFKARGAHNAVMSLDAEAAARGVVTHSSGNHGQALALAARARGVPAYVVMPSNSPAIKKAAVDGYGAVRIDCEPTNAAREATAAAVCREKGAEFVHPSNDVRVMAGQGTMGLELVEQIREMVKDAARDEPPFDAVFVPVGGGGMISGVATAIKGLCPSVRILGAEPAAAGDAARSLHEGHICDHDAPPKTIADGLKTILGSNNFPIIQHLVEDIVLVREEEIVAAMRLVWERLKVVIEPSSAVGVAALFSDHFAPLVDAPGKRPIRRVAVILCGGNADLDKLPWQS